MSNNSNPRKFPRLSSPIDLEQPTKLKRMNHHTRGHPRSSGRDAGDIKSSLSPTIRPRTAWKRCQESSTSRPIHPLRVFHFFPLSKRERWTRKRKGMKKNKKRKRKKKEEEEDDSWTWFSQICQWDVLEATISPTVPPPVFSVPSLGDAFNGCSTAA